MQDAEIKKILLEQHYVDEESVKKAEEYTKGKKDSSIVDYLISARVITLDILGQAIAEAFSVPYADLNSNQPNKEQVLKIPEEIAFQFRVVLFKDGEKEISITTDNPEQGGLLESIKSVFPKKEIKVMFSLPGDIDKAFLYYQKPLDTRFSKIIEGQTKIAPEILDEIFYDAYTLNASDIHFEPHGNEVLVRFRVDGVLQEAGRIPQEYYDNILNRVKILSRLRIDEHFAAQDGSIKYERGEIRFDMRTSIAPTVHGEKIVLRVLGAYVEGFGLGDLGLSLEDQKIVEEFARKPFGMILVTGPTGSGKTTTLYSLLRMINSPRINITTIEDPVEYKILEANQIQVNKETGLTFSRGLRSIVRQDPDVILVGEIRDGETAGIAVNAALTGHLLLSTFHANDAATTVPRLFDMDIEPFLLASTLEVIVAQRLVRKICNDCRYSVEMSQKEIKEVIGKTPFFGKKKVTLYKGKGCQVCNHTGYTGRTGIFEFIKVTPEMKELILENPSTNEVWELARKQGTKSMFEDGVEKVKKGVTTLEELTRVASPPKD